MDPRSINKVYGSILSDAAKSDQDAVKEKKYTLALSSTYVGRRIAACLSNTMIYP